MYIAILGRQPTIGLAELERRFGADSLQPFSEDSTLIETNDFDISKFGGVTKAGVVVGRISGRSWHSVSQWVVKKYLNELSSQTAKITLGISVYGFKASAREVQKTGIILKQKLKLNGVNLRLIPNQESTLSSATSHHNKLGLSSNRIELLILKSTNGEVVVAESTGAQNITDYARRDRERPMRDTYVGMLPPKLAQIMINLASPQREASDTRLLDPFCGTGVILQEAALLNRSVYGTDLSEKMIRYTRDNLNWLEETYRRPIDWYVHVGDAMDARWQQPIDQIASETYLGQPFSAPPSPAKLAEVRKNCNYIITSFLQNIHGQIASGTPLCLAVPAWKDIDGHFTHLPLVRNLAELGFKEHSFKHAPSSTLIYHREDQIVARQLLVIEKI